MTSPPDLFDHTALAHRRNRAASGWVDFLQREAAEQVAERLLEVNRQFTRVLIIGPMAGFWREILIDFGAIVAAEICPDTETLAFEADQFDLIIHAWALHWTNDPVGQLIQARHLLQQDGMFIACLAGGRSLHELRSCFAEAESALTGGLSPRVIPMAELRDLGGLLQRAGFALPVADTTTRKVSYSSLIALMHDLRFMGETNVMHARRRISLRRDVLALTSVIYEKNFALEAGRIGATAELIFLTGWKPDPGQQQPLRPGSAANRLAEALGTQEQILGAKSDDV